MAKLPYYSLYPGDFDSDERMRSLDDCEVGLFLRCLNHAWLNNGLPDDPEEIERIIPGKRSPETFQKLWERVSKCFIRTTAGRLVNHRQEEEREKALGKSAKAKDSAGRRWSNHDANALRTHCESDANAIPAHMPSQSERNALQIHTHTQTKTTDDANALRTHDNSLVDAFENFIARYPNRVGTEEACRQWVSMVGSEITMTSLSEVMAGLNRWIASRQWKNENGKYIPKPSNWLRDRLWKDSPQPAEEEYKPPPSSSAGTDCNAEWIPPWKKEREAA